MRLDIAPEVSIADSHRSLDGTPQGFPTRRRADSTSNSHGVKFEGSSRRFRRSEKAPEACNTRRTTAMPDVSSSGRSSFHWSSMASVVS